MEINRNNILYVIIIIFIIPSIVLTSIILSSKIEVSNLESNIISHEQNKTECYNLTYNFINNKQSNKIYLSLDSYLESFLVPCIVIIVAYSAKIIFTAFFGLILECSKDGIHPFCLCIFELPARLIFFVPLIVFIVILRIRSNIEFCQDFIDYYNFCSDELGDNFKYSFSNIMNISTYTLWIIILFVLEIIYHGIIFCYIGIRS